MAKKEVGAKGITIGVACEIFSISETCYRYKYKLSSENTVIVDWLLRLTHNQKNWGLGFVIYTYGTLKALAGTTNVFIEYTRNWN